MVRTNEQVAELFQRMADHLQARQENPYRIRAYRRAAETLVGLHEDLRELAARGEVESVPGIGKDLSAKIHEFLRSGTMQSYEATTRPLPAEIADWATLPGLSEPLVQHLYFKLGISTLDDLAALAKSHMLRTLPSFGGDESALLDAIATRTGPQST
ncbi:MAG: histidinol-phosphatase [Nitrospiraceae bacterium]